MMKILHFGRRQNLQCNVAALAHALRSYGRYCRAVRIELFTVRVLCRASYRILKYSTDTGVAVNYRVAQTNGHLDSFQLIIQEHFEMKPKS